MTSGQAAAAEHHDYVGAKMGMWLFLLTELVLFGGLFIAYAAYRGMHPVAFHHASGELNVSLGVLNTVFLLTSSLTMALGISAIQQGKKSACLAFVGTTVALGLAFLGVKFFEWSAKIHHGLYPGSARVLELPPGERLFFGLYFTMTGLHGLHVIVGVTLLAVMWAWVAKGRIAEDRFVYLENSGLYWHLVDVIWIFLLPLFYLAA